MDDEVERAPEAKKPHTVKGKKQPSYQTEATNYTDLHFRTVFPEVQRGWDFPWDTKDGASFKKQNIEVHTDMIASAVSAA